MKLSVCVFLAILLSFSIVPTKAQVVNLKKVEQGFVTKYSFKECSMIKYENIYFTLGSSSDTNDFELSLFKKENSPQLYNISLHIGSTSIIYDGDSIFTVYANGKVIRKKADKANLNWLQFINGSNPFFKSKAFFNYISSSSIINQDTVQGKSIITLLYSSNKKETEYRLNVSDTIIISYKIQAISNNEVINLSKSVYAMQRSVCENDFEHIKRLVLSSESIKASTFNNSKKIFQVGQVFDKWHFSLNEDSVNITSIDKSYYLIDLWYIGCKPCMQAIPDMIRIANEFDYVEVVGINTMNNDFDYIKLYKEKNKIQYSFLINQQIGIEYQTVYPCFLVLNKKMEILYIETGFSQKRIKTLKSFLERLPH